MVYVLSYVRGPLDVEWSQCCYAGYGVRLMYRDTGSRSLEHARCQHRRQSWSKSRSGPSFAARVRGAKGITDMKQQSASGSTRCHASRILLTLPRAH